MMQQALTGRDSLADNIVHGNRAGGKPDKNTKISSNTANLQPGRLRSQFCFTSSDSFHSVREFKV